MLTSSCSPLASPCRRCLVPVAGPRLCTRTSPTSAQPRTSACSWWGRGTDTARVKSEVFSSSPSSPASLGILSALRSSTSARHPEKASMTAHSLAAFAQPCPLSRQWSPPTGPGLRTATSSTHRRASDACRAGERAPRVAAALRGRPRPHRRRRRTGPTSGFVASASWDVTDLDLPLRDAREWRHTYTASRCHYPDAREGHLAADRGTGLVAGERLPGPRVDSAHGGAAVSRVDDFPSPARARPHDHPRAP